jgi:hypothetical protein
VRTILPIILLACAARVAGADLAFACIRVVRAQAGDPSAPALTLPAGYRLRTEAGSEVAAPGEYHVFISGPSGTAHVGISWPGIAIASVIEGDAYLPLAGDPANGATSCDVPVRHATMLDAWDTLDVASYLDEPDLAVRVDHNHPARRAGWYAQNPWPAAEARAAVVWTFAARTVLHDWGLPEQVTAAGAGHLSILGFESVNPLHLDYPPHWHLIQYWPGDTGSLIPHYYLDGSGAIASCKVQVLNLTQPDRFFSVGDAIVFADPDGGTRFATRIRDDGGLDLGTSPSQWTYAIIPGADGGFTASARILRDGQMFAAVAASDDVATGVTHVLIAFADGRTLPEEQHLYDPLTGVTRASAASAPAYGVDDPNAPLGGSASGDARRCGIGSGLALALALIALRAGWLRAAVSRVGSGAAAGWRVASTRLSAWSTRSRSRP